MQQPIEKQKNTKTKI